MDFHMLATFVVIIVTIIAFISERWSIEFISLSAITTLLLLFSLYPLPNGSNNSLTATTILAGFANPALITILSLLIIGQALYETNALAPITERLQTLKPRYCTLAAMGIIISAGAISAFLNNTPVVVMFLPILAGLASRGRIATSKLFMPLSFASILGGMTTLIGSSTNILVADVAARNSHIQLGFFDFTFIGLLLAIPGILYILFIMPHLLPERKTMADEMGKFGKQFIAQIVLGTDHPLIGTRSVGGHFPKLDGMAVRVIEREERPLLPPFEDIELVAHDRIIVAATRAVITEALSSGAQLIQSKDEGKLIPLNRRLSLIEVVVAPGSRLIGRKIGETQIRSQTGCTILGVQRRSRMPRHIDEIRLEAGDVLLIGGSSEAIDRLRSTRDLLLLDQTADNIPHPRHANQVLFTLMAIIAATVSGLLPLVTAAMAGALVIIGCGCLNIRQAARAIDGRIIMLIAAGLALSTALEASGGANFLAMSLANAMAGLPIAYLLSAFFLLVAIITNLLSNNATAVLFTPIAISLAKETGYPQEAFILAVLFAANCSFASPIGYQTNLLVMGPGHYRFRDFIVAGMPLVLIIWLIFSLIAPWYYSL